MIAVCITCYCGASMTISVRYPSEVDRLIALWRQMGHEVTEKS